MDVSLKGKVALVMGVENGVGRALAVAMAEAGADVACCATRPSLEVAAQSCANEVWALGRRSLGAAVTATEAHELEALVDKVMAELGGLHILVNAHDLPLALPLEETEPHYLRRVLADNVEAVYLAIRAASRPMLAQGYGRIINVVPLEAERGLANASAYCAAKAAVLNLTRALALEWARRGITVNALGCGWIEGEGLAQSPEAKAALERYLPYKRLAKPQEVVGPAVYLASEAAGFITGHVIWVDGGALSHI